MTIFGGPFLPPGQFSQLQKIVADQPQVTMRTYTNHFLDYMYQADLSLSLAGYNTCMNILATGVPALVMPFTGGGDDEQTTRARKLEQLGLVGVISPDALEPQLLASQMRQRMEMGRVAATLDMRGVEKTAAFLSGLIAETVETLPTLPRSVDPGNEAPNLRESRARPDKSAFDALRSVLDQLQAEKPVDFFLRDDDVDEDEETLRRLMDISLSRAVPLNLEVIPGRLTKAAIRLIKEHRRSYAPLLELHQHGWMHVNHEANGRKCEFGPSRTREQQLADIAQGKTLLEEAFQSYFFPAFTPPWNRCTEATFAALDELGFAVLSRDRDPEDPDSRDVTTHHFREIPITLDLFRWRDGARLKSPDEIIGAIIYQIGRNDRIGIMLHHKVMDAEAFGFVDRLLAELRRYPFVRFHTFQSLTGQ